MRYLVSILFLCLCASLVVAQGTLVKAYVDPANGNDGSAQIGSKTQTFRTIQAAIDLVQVNVVIAHGSDPTARGVVYCMPGVYGPGAADPVNHDTLPIVMRDRVSVKGQGARRTIIRGGMPQKDLYPGAVFWPDSAACGDEIDKFGREVLVDFSLEDSSFAVIPAPWSDNTADTIDGFTFQGGDVQVFCEVGAFAEYEPTGVVSNCIFDMRHEWDIDDVGTTLDGPWIGMYAVQTWDEDADTYYPNRISVLNNTFVFAEHSIGGPPANVARAGSVGIIDVNNPRCSLAGLGDPDPTLRGIGNMNIQNNIIRTHESSQFAMLGVDFSDAFAMTGTSTGTTNAFHGSRVGGSNGTFFSQTTVAPAPKVDLATRANDPWFVGEALSIIWVGTSNLYRDWRILPMSPMIDQGCAPDMGTLRALNTTAYIEPGDSELSSFTWDGEAWGNPRIVDEVDIGFDESHMMIMAGSWSNDSNSHNNLPVSQLNPSVTFPGISTRYALFPSSFSGALVSVNGKSNLLQAQIGGGFVINAWERQPGTLATPVFDGTAVPDHQTRYISYRNNYPAPTPWVGTVVQTGLVNPTSPGLSASVGMLIIQDNEVSTQYFNAQAYIRQSGLKYHSNLQSEYR